MSASFLIDWEASLPCCCVQASVAIRCMPATNPAYLLASYLLARSGRKSTGKTKLKLLRPRHQIARINVRYGRSRPARRTGIAKSYYPAKTGQLPSKPDRLSAVFLFGGELALPHGSHRLSGEDGRKQRRIAMRATASPDRFFKIRRDAGAIAGQLSWISGRNRLGTKYLLKFNGLGVEATSGIEPEYTVLQTVA